MTTLSFFSFVCTITQHRAILNNSRFPLLTWFISNPWWKVITFSIKCGVIFFTKLMLKNGIAHYFRRPNAHVKSLGWFVYKIYTCLLSGLFSIMLTNKVYNVDVILLRNGMDTPHYWPSWVTGGLPHIGLITCGLFSFDFSSNKLFYKRSSRRCLETPLLWTGRNLAPNVKTSDRPEESVGMVYRIHIRVLTSYQDLEI